MEEVDSETGVGLYTSLSFKGFIQPENTGPGTEYDRHLDLKDGRRTDGPLEYVFCRVVRNK